MSDIVALFTDFGANGPYIGQMTVALRGAGYTGDVINLFADAPSFSVKASSRLLSAYMTDFPKETLFLCIVDPGVGGPRLPVVVRSCDRWFVGPDNGLFEYILRLDEAAEAWEIIWRPERLSSSFHGRDLFAPVAAKILAGSTNSIMKKMAFVNLQRFEWPEDLLEIVYIDHYGNGLTGIKSSPGQSNISINGIDLSLSNTFSSVGKGEPLAYCNANGLIEIAVNQGRADEYFNLSIGSPVGLAMF